MKLLKPNWVSHDGNPIFSVDLHPDGSRFATGGQGDGGSSGKVVVWNTSPIVNAKDEHNEEIPKVLCVMENHLACVNCVRWSCNGKYLASGGDDRIIMIWQFAGYGRATTFGSSDTIASGLNGERWRGVHTLKKHTGDVLHLAWSPADQWLASCSIDNTIVIWNATKFPEVSTVLKGHTSLVKGVTWDPVGTYLASQSDDKSIRIWKTLDWKQEATVTKPFEECGATTHVLRLDWSPDGGYLVSAHAMNNSGPTAQIIERRGWKTNMDFVGHRKAITCTRFNGRMFRRHPVKAGEGPRLPYTCCAVGSRDRSLSIWLTSLRRPLVVVNDLFDDSVMDISWSYDGLSLLCCSWDGSVAYVEFKPEEIGEALSREEMNELYEKTYGKSMSIVSQPLVIENPAMLAIQQRKAEESTVGSAEKAIPEPKTPTKYPTKQVEVRTPSGKRRITPIFVAAQEELGGVPRPFGSAFGSSTNLSSNLNKSPTKTNRLSTPERKKSDPIVGAPSCTKPAKTTTSLHTNGVRPKASQDRRSPGLLNVTSGKMQKEKDKDALLQRANLDEQKKSILDSRIAEKSPTTFGNADKHAKLQKLPVKSRSEKKQQQKSPSGRDAARDGGSEVQIQPPVATQPKKSGRPPGFTSKRKVNDAGGIPGDSPKQPKRVKKDQHILTPGLSKHPTPAQQSLLSKLASIPLPVQADRLPPKKVPKTLSVQVSDTDGFATVKLHNDSSSLHGQKNTKIGTLHKLVCSRAAAAQWESVTSAPGVAMDGNRNLVCVACEDCTVRLFSSASGRQLVPTICVRGKPYAVRCSGWNAMVICCDASVSVWDVQNTRCVLASESFSHLVPERDAGAHSEQRKSHEDCSASGADHHNNTNGHSSDSSKDKRHTPLRHCDITSAGMPLLTFENKKSYAFSKDMMTWVLVNCMNASLELCADYKNDRSADAPSGGILESLQKKASGVGACALRMFHTHATSQRSATVVFLENRVETCIALDSVAEYHYWLLAYVRHLVNQGLDVRLREVCDEMLGPTHIKSGDFTSEKAATGTTWKPYVLGIFKRTLLHDEILPIIGSNLNFQRLYTEYQDQLDVCTSSGAILLK